MSRTIYLRHITAMRDQTYCNSLNLQFWVQPLTQETFPDPAIGFSLVVRQASRFTTWSRHGLTLRVSDPQRLPSDGTTTSQEAASLRDHVKTLSRVMAQHERQRKKVKKSTHAWLSPLLSLSSEQSHVECLERPMLCNPLTATHKTVRKRSQSGSKQLS